MKFHILYKVVFYMPIERVASYRLQTIGGRICELISERAEKYIFRPAIGMAVSVVRLAYCHSCIVLLKLKMQDSEIEFDSEISLRTSPEIWKIITSQLFCIKE